MWNQDTPHGVAQDKAKKFGQDQKLNNNFAHFREKQKYHKKAQESGVNQFQIAQRYNHIDTEESEDQFSRIKPMPIQNQPDLKKSPSKKLASVSPYQKNKQNLPKPSEKFSKYNLIDQEIDENTGLPNQDLTQRKPAQNNAKQMNISQGSSQKLNLNQQYNPNQQYNQQNQPIIQNNLNQQFNPYYQQPNNNQQQLNHNKFLMDQIGGQTDESQRLPSKTSEKSHQHKPIKKMFQNPQQPPRSPIKQDFSKYNQIEEDHFNDIDQFEEQGFIKKNVSTLLNREDVVFHGYSPTHNNKFKRQQSPQKKILWDPPKSKTNKSAQKYQNQEIQQDDDENQFNNMQGVPEFHGLESQLQPLDGVKYQRSNKKRGEQKLEWQKTPQKQKNYNQSGQEEETQFRYTIPKNQNVPTQHDLDNLEKTKKEHIPFTEMKQETYKRPVKPKLKWNEYEQDHHKWHQYENEIEDNQFNYQMQKTDNRPPNYHNHQDQSVLDYQDVSQIKKKKTGLVWKKAPPNHNHYQNIEIADEEDNQFQYKIQKEHNVPPNYHGQQQDEILGSPIDSPIHNQIPARKKQLWQPKEDNFEKFRQNQVKDDVPSFGMDATKYQNFVRDDITEKVNKNKEYWEKEQENKIQQQAQIQRRMEELAKQREQQLAKEFKLRKDVMDDPTTVNPDLRNHFEQQKKQRQNHFANKYNNDEYDEEPILVDEQQRLLEKFKEQAKLKAVNIDTTELDQQTLQEKGQLKEFMLSKDKVRQFQAAKVNKNLEQQANKYRDFEKEEKLRQQQEIMIPEDEEIQQEKLKKQQIYAQQDKQQIKKTQDKVKDRYLNQSPQKTQFSPPVQKKKDEEQQSPMLKLQPSQTPKKKAQIKEPPKKQESSEDEDEQQYQEPESPLKKQQEPESPIKKSPILKKKDPNMDDFATKKEQKTPVKGWQKPDNPSEKKLDPKKIYDQKYNEENTLKPFKQIQVHEYDEQFDQFLQVAQKKPDQMLDKNIKTKKMIKDGSTLIRDQKMGNEKYLQNIERCDKPRDLDYENLENFYIQMGLTQDQNPNKPKPVKQAPDDFNNSLNNPIKEGDLKKLQQLRQDHVVKKQNEIEDKQLNTYDQKQKIK